MKFKENILQTILNMRGIGKSIIFKLNIPKRRKGKAICQGAQDE